MENTLEILNSTISGYHQYILNEPVHLSFASENLCDMLNVSDDELISESDNLFFNFVHPDYAETYLDFIKNLKEKEQTLSCDYSLVLKKWILLFC